MWNNEQGEFVRYKSGFRDWVKADGSTQFVPEANRYHLYISLACPWAHRTLLTLQLRKLDRVIGVSAVEPVWNANGWYFSDALPDHENGQPDLVSVYRLADPKFNGEESTPVLWDSKHKTIVNNESREIMRMMNTEFGEFVTGPELAPKNLQPEIDRVIDLLYQPINNGVYRAGFATQQAAYERAVREVFSALDEWEQVLSKQIYLCGDQFTEADISFFTTLIRFDPVYYGHFKCNWRRIVDYPALWRYIRRIYHIPGVAETCNFEHIKKHYYGSHSEINPTGIVPTGPVMDYSL